MKSIQKITAALMLITLGSSLQIAQAKPSDTPPPPPPACKLSDVQITSYQKQDGSLAIPTLINATACYGAFGGNDDVSNLGNNLGYDDIGWLNQESPEYWPGTDPENPLPGAFITDADLQDLQDNDLGFVDPGWIFFGKYGDTGNSFVPSSSNKDGVTYNYAADLISLSQCKNAADEIVPCGGEGVVKGEWTYKPPVTNPEELLNMLGADKFFDQVTVVFKSAHMFAMYNFNIAAFGLPAVVGTTDENYMFKGVWDMSTTLMTNGNKNPGGLSHISIWGRDPVSTDTPPPVDVSAPMSLALTGLALLLLGIQRRRQR